MDLTIAYPLWALILCPLLGTAYAYFLYRFDQRIAEAPATTRWGLGILRGVVVTLIAFFLFKPLIQSVKREVDRPVVVVAQDGSASLKVGSDSTFYKETYPKQMEKLRERLSADYDVRGYTFGKDVEEGIEYGFKEKETNISSVFEAVRDRYADRNLGAVILASDGIYNRGRDPRYATSAIEAPVYTVALGDTSVRRDLLIPEVLHNRLAYLGNRFPLEVLVEGKKLEGASTTLKVKKDGQVLHQETIELNTSSYSRVHPVELEAEETGLQHYEIVLGSVDDEVSYVNNKKDVFIDILDSRQRVLILADAPHPDIAALRHAIQSKEQYEVDVAFAEEYDGGVADHDLVILHQLPSNTHPLKKLQDSLRELNKPRMFVYGGNTDLDAVTDLGGSLTIDNFTGKMNEASAELNTDFTLFQLDKEMRNLVAKLPPLFVPFGEYGKKGGVEVLFRQKVNGVKTTDPLIAFGQSRQTKIAVIGGEGIWRWKLYGYKETGKNKVFNELITKMVQYLAAKEDRSYFRVSSRNDFLENEPIVFKAELYDKSYELVNGPDVMMTIEDKAGKEYPYSFSRTSDAYRLDAGQLPVGEYQYTARTRYNGKEYTETGQFTVSPVQIERSKTVADHQLLYQLARDHGGKMVYPSNMDRLGELLAKNKDIAPVTYREKQLSDLIDLKWLFFLILALLTGEWVVRKLMGGY